MELRDPVAARAEFQGEHRHAEGLLRVAPVLAPQRQELPLREPQRCGHLPEVAHDQPMIESVVPLGNRRVRREDRTASDLRNGPVAGLPARHEPADPFERAEGRVPLVEMKDRRLDFEHIERHQPAHAQQDFLANAVLRIARAVEVMRQSAIPGGVPRQVRIQQIDRHAPHRQPPYLRLHPRSADGNRDEPARLLDGNGFEVRRGVDHPDGAVLAQFLTVVALAPENPDRHEGDSEIAGRLHMVPRENPQPPGVQGQALVDAVLHAEIRDLQRSLAAPRRALEPGPCPKIRLEFLLGMFEGSQKIRVPRDRLAPRRRESREGGDRIVIGGASKTRRASGFQVHQRFRASRSSRPNTSGAFDRTRVEADGLRRRVAVAIAERASQVRDRAAVPGHAGRRRNQMGGAEYTGHAPRPLLRNPSPPEYRDSRPTGPIWGCTGA